MFHITQVDILGFWGKYRVATDFHPDVNIFIGKNGTGKTTFLNLLQAVLRADLSAIMSLDFKRVTVTLKSNSEIKTISVLKK